MSAPVSCGLDPSDRIVAAIRRLGKSEYDYRTQKVIADFLDVMVPPVPEGRPKLTLVN